MSIFGDIWNKITGADANAATTAPSDPASSTEGTPAATPAAMAEVDIETILSSLAAQKGGESNWRTSIVDLMKLLDLDPSLANRKELANELDVHAGADGTAEQNMALHQAVVQKLEANGGKVPDSMKS